ncbi:MarR family transcriptional regulator [Lacticaseibacillus chiayiensis]|uniref:MarR family transcriptional regulator n=1 Tax=Lacticaseibacillus chiayiensis TaxID=2100821 RepID=A0A4Q1UCN5_9LACO|nr:MarR family transcriptional regulator [Lacticaseibacillus chiayiensis]QVI34679.1 MarR family transcriptional regulator [Lacticaseibacillus chiayiensis]RXT29744.1 MarR family transcriptional regulator [Lacticaseibacillus chiayiensis]RXT58798.1 MarR family transcriptional regulator [Lacticaseibacillus chiayiensis]UYN56429.1 MarR family transcriptional regulator [Lacticaseibacillus chiayiensis]
MPSEPKAALAAGKLAEYEQLSKIYDDIIKQPRPHLTVEGQGKVLLVLADEDRLSQRQLANRLAMSPQSVNEFVYKLVSRGLVTLDSSPRDKRVKLVSLTSAGRETIENAAREVPTFLRALSDDELSQLTELLDKVTKAMYTDIDNANPTAGVKLHKLFASRYLNRFKKQKM